MSDKNQLGLSLYSHTSNLRPYQEKAVKLIFEALNIGENNVLLYLPTGAGKTETAIAVIRDYLSRGKRVMFVVNLNTLVSQTGARFIKNGLPEFTTIWGNKNYDKDAQLTVASVWTLARRNIKLEDYDLVVIDEAHKSSCESYLPIYQRCKGKILGLTATPFLDSGTRFSKTHPLWPAKRKQIGRFYQILVHVVGAKDLMNQGYLVDCEIATYQTVASKRQGLKVDPRNNEFIPCYVSRIYDIPEMWEHLYREYLARGNNQPALGFAVNIKHAQNLTNYFNQQGIPSEYICANTKEGDRKKIFTRFLTGETKVIFSVNVLAEGLDLPSATVALMSRPTNLLSVLIQMAGRVLRPYPNKGKAIIIDQADNFNAHGFHPWDYLKISLDVTDDLPEEKEKEEKEKEEKDEDFATKLEFKNLLQDRENRIIDSLLANQKDRGYKPYWVVINYIKYTCFPSLASFERLAKELNYQRYWAIKTHALAQAFNEYVATENINKYKLSKDDVEKILNWCSESNNPGGNCEQNLDKMLAEIQQNPKQKSYSKILKEAYAVGGKNMLKRVYKKLCFILHPDRNPEINHKFIQTLNTNYDALARTYGY